MKTVLFWFRSDLRLHDQPALAHATALAAQQGAALLPVFCHAPPATTRWGFERVGPHRQAFLASTLACLSAALAARGSRLLECAGTALDMLPALAQALGLSPRTLARRMQAHTGLTAALWMRRIKLRQASEALCDTPLPLKRIAEDLGFASEAGLHRAFRQATGQTPLAYRMSHG